MKEEWTYAGGADGAVQPTHIYFTFTMNVEWER